MRDAIRRLKDGVWYECRPAANGVFYAFWSEQRRSRRESMGTKEVGQASARFDEWLTLRGSAPRSAVAIAALWALHYGEKNASMWKNLGPTFGGLLPSAVTQDVVDRFVAGRTSGRISARGKKATPGSARTELACLLACINNGALRRVKLVAPEDVPAVELPPKPQPRDRWLTDGEIGALTNAAAGAERMSRVERFLWIALDACARRGAIQELRWDNGQVDLERRVIDFNPPGRTPTRKRRAVVPMSDRLFLILRRAYDERTGPLVLDIKRNINDDLTALAERAGVPRVTPHVLRHTAATHMLRRGVPIWTVAKLLGDTVQTVEMVYGKWVADFGRDAVEMTGGRGAAPGLRIVGGE
jgi:integrase